MLLMPWLPLCLCLQREGGLSSSHISDEAGLQTANTSADDDIADEVGMPEAVQYGRRRISEIGRQL